jgi:TonB family protein
MRAIAQVRARETEDSSTVDSEARIAAPVAVSDNPLQLLREAIACLNSSNGELADQAEVVDLLAEAREALERASLISRAVAQYEEFLRAAQFDKAFQALDAGLLAYPGDAALTARRSEVEERQRKFESAATARTALEEAEWLLDHDRPDLAANFLKEKAAGLPDQPALTSRLEALEALLPQWEQNRHVQAALGRAEALEQLQQWQAAMTILEEALQSYSASEELTGAARRVRDRLADHERQMKLARREELIGQKIAAQSWRQALTLLDTTESEFPGAPNLNPLRREADAGLRRSECEAIVAEVRQCVADGEPEQAEQALRRGLESIGPEPALDRLREELESEGKYREELRTAQTLFGRRQLQEAERVLVGLMGQDRPEAQALLDAVRQARAATEEENFCERGRERALRLMQQQQFAQAVDLLGNLLSLFPGNPILERDLIAAQAALGREAPHAIAVVEEANSAPEAPAPPPPLVALLPEPETRRAIGGTTRVSHPSRVRRAAIAGTASLVLVSASGAAWKLSRARAPISTPKATPLPIRLSAATPLPDAREADSGGAARLPEAPQEVSPQPPAHPPLAASGAAPEKWKARPETPPDRPLRPFVPPATRQAPVETSGSVLPFSPATGAIVSAQAVPGLPAVLGKPGNAPVPPGAAGSAPAATPALPTGGKFQEAQLLDRKLPEYPAAARQHGLYGTVRMEAMIDENGAVKNVKVVSGDPLLAASARAAVLQWKYKAATLDGHPIAVSAVIQFVFENPNK